MRVPTHPRFLLGGLVLSHWVLDVITHVADLPLWPGNSPKLGLGLWNSIPGTFVIEGALWIASIVVYLRGRRARRPLAGPIAFWSFVVASTLVWAPGPWSPPPPNERALAWFALIGWITVPWAAFADRYYVASSDA